MSAAIPRTSLELLWQVRDVTDPRLRLVHRAVLFAMVSFRDQAGTISPSVTQLAKTLGADAKTIRRAEHDLAGWGYVTVQARSRAGRHLSNEYKLVLPVVPYSQDAGTPTTPVLPSREQGTPTTGVGYSRLGRGVLPGTVPSEDLSEDQTEDLTEEQARAAVASPAFVAEKPLLTLTGEREAEMAKNKNEKNRKTEKKINRLIPDDFVVSPAMLAMCRAERLPDPHRVLPDFRDWALSKAETKADWEATFRRWMRDARTTANYPPIAQEPRHVPLPPEPEGDCAPPSPEEAAKLEQELRDIVDPVKAVGASFGAAEIHGETLTPAQLERQEAKRRAEVAKLRVEITQLKAAEVESKDATGAAERASDAVSGRSLRGEEHRVSG